MKLTMYPDGATLVRCGIKHRWESNKANGNTKISNDQNTAKEE